MPKFPPDPLSEFTLESTIRKYKLRHLRVRKHGDLFVLESGPKNDPVTHIRLRRVTRQWYTLEIATRHGWQRVPLRARAADVLETVVHEFPWVLAPIA